MGPLSAAIAFAAAISAIRARVSGGRAADMRWYDVRQGQQRDCLKATPVRWRNIDAGGEQVAVTARRPGVFINDAAAGSIDQHCTWLHQPDSVDIE